MTGSIALALAIIITFILELKEWRKNMSDELRLGEVQCAYCEKRFISEDDCFEHWLPDHEDQDEFRVVRIDQIVAEARAWGAKATLN